MNWKLSTHVSTDGFSVVEVLVAMTITSVFSAAALSIAFSTQGLLDADERRTTVNQNLRAGRGIAEEPLSPFSSQYPW